MKFTVELTADQVATLERLQAMAFPAESLGDIARHLLEVAIGNEENIQRNMDEPPPHMSEPVPF